jgi:hypothetical protein
MEILNNLAERVISGEKLTKEEGLQILSIPDELVMELVEEASKVREYFLKTRWSFAV